jgi:small subunit ribosomal protein S14
MKLRQSYKLSELNNLKKKIVYNNNLLAKSTRKQAHETYSKISTDRAPITVMRNRCLITGRGRGIIKEYAVSRIIFRQLADQGKIPGIRKASW